MLGRLGMSVEKTISHYAYLAGEVFSDKQPSRAGKLKASKLEKVIKEIVRRRPSKKTSV